MKTKEIVTWVVCASLASVGLSACKDRKQDQAAAAAAARQMAPLSVSVMNLHKQDVDMESTWFGHLRGVQEANIKPEVTGKLLKQVYWDGSLCKEGEVLFEIGPESYTAALSQADAAVAVAQASVEQAKAADDQAAKDVERYEKLVDSGSISEKNYTDALHAHRRTQAALAVAMAAEQQAVAQQQIARINLKRCTIRAPFTGVASKANVSVGDLITAGGMTLTTMSSIDPIRVDFVVPGKQILAKLLAPTYRPDEGMVSPVKKFRIVLEDGTVYDHEGEVVAVDSYVNSSTGTVNFVGYLPNPELKLRSGSAVRVRAKTGVQKDALLVPSRALVSSMNHRFIYIVGRDGTPYGIDVIPGDEVTLNMPNGDGKTVPMLMQMITGRVKPLEDSLKELGYEDPQETPVIIEGGQMAAIYAQANMGMRAAGIKQGFGTVNPHPFIYTHPTTTTPSVTAKQ